MITQYKLRLTRADGAPIPVFWAYWLYAWLLEQLPEEMAEHLHGGKKYQLSQHLNQEQIWTVNIFNKDVSVFLGRVFENIRQIDLHTDRIFILDLRCKVVERPEDFLQYGRGLINRRVKMRFVSPASFKQSGRYTIFPREELILQSLLMKWNTLCSEYLLDDEDMLMEMEKGFHIVDYRLYTSRFPLKDITVPCFYGKIILEARLPIVLRELLGALLSLAPYSGVGIKTTLGMGGVEIF